MKKGYKECPFCKNEIKKEAIKCMYCKEMLSEVTPIEKHPDTKICPFCKNEIKFDAIKCQYCHEMLDSNINKKVKKNVKVDKFAYSFDAYSKDVLATKWSRFWAWFFDIFFSFTFIWWIINFILALTEWSTVWLKVAWIRLESLDGELNFKQKFLRFISYVPFWYALLVIIMIPFMIFWLNDRTLEMILYPIMAIIFTINIVELFYSVPTFIDKWLGIVKIRYKWITTRAIVVIFLLIVFLANILTKIQLYQ